MLRDTSIGFKIEMRQQCIFYSVVSGNGCCIIEFKDALYSLAC